MNRVKLLSKNKMNSFIKKKPTLFRASGELKRTYIEEN
jgi:hypothetical protein